MAAPEDNNYAMKFKTPEERQALRDAYIQHIQSGLSDECFPECDMDTFHRYEQDFPEDFPTDMLNAARRRRQLFWEKAGVDGTMGQIKGFNAKSWQFNMGNRFGWKEKREDTVKIPKDAAQELSEKLMGKAATLPSDESLRTGEEPEASAA